MISKRTGLAVAASAAVLAAGGLVAYSTSEEPATSTTGTVTDPYPEPPWGTRVWLGGRTGTSCAQNVSVTVRKSSPGLLFKNPGPGTRWWTKSEVLALNEAPSPPFIKGKLQPGQWLLQHLFTDVQRYRIYMANSNCPGATLAYKWNATIITVSIVE